MKKRLAVIGGGAHTIPSYRKMLKLIAREYEVTVFSEFYIDKKAAMPEYAIQSVSGKKMNRRIRELVFFFLLAKTCVFKPPHIIHSHSTYPSGFVATLLGWFFRVPVVVCLDAAEGSGVPEIAFGDILNQRRKKVNAWVIKRAAAVTALTQFQKEDVRRNLAISRPIQIISRGIDPVGYMVNRPLQLHTPLRFLSVAYFHPVKDHETMLRAFQLILQKVDATLMLVGQDYMNGHIQELARALNIDQQVTFAGFIPHDSIAAYYKQADIFLHTARFESQAIAVVEAMAAGVLVCGTHVGIMADLSNKCCITVPVKAHDQLANHVLQLIDEPASQQRLRSAALEWVNSHSLTWTTQQYLNLYSELIK